MVATRPNPFRPLQRLLRRVRSWFQPPEDHTWPPGQIGPRQRASAADARRRAGAFLEERRRAARDLLAES